MSEPIEAMPSGTIVTRRTLPDGRLEESWYQPDGGYSVFIDGRLLLDASPWEVLEDDPSP